MKRFLLFISSFIIVVGSAVAVYLGAFASDFQINLIRALAGNSKAAYAVGMAYESGDGVTRDYGRARRWYERAAAEGNAQVYMKLARLSFLGLDGAKNEAEGASWVKKAAETGSEEASGLLGALYYGGIGVKQDFDEAAKWLKTSADADVRSLAAKIETDAALNANLPPEEREARRQQAYAEAETQIRALLGKILARSAPPTRAQKQ